MPELVVAALLQAGGGSPWAPLIVLAVAGYGSAVVLCLVVGGGILATAGFDPDNKAKGLNWIKRGLRAGVFGLLVGSIYAVFNGLF